MNTSTKLKFFICLPITFMMFKCTYDKAEETPGGTQVSYLTDIKPIIEANCYRCHSTSATDPNKPGYAFFDNFNELKEYALKRSTVNAAYTVLQARIRHVESPGMPFNASKLSESDIVKIEAWINGGALNN